MIKILTSGTRNTITCNFCGAVLQYDKKDIKETEHSVSPRESYAVKYVICPQCKDMMKFRRTNNEVSTNKTN